MEYSKLHTPHAFFSPNLMPIKRKVQGKVHYHWKKKRRLGELLAKMFYKMRRRLRKKKCVWLVKRIFFFLVWDECRPFFYSYHISYIESLLSSFFDT